MTVAEGGVGVGAGREQGGLVERERSDSDYGGLQTNNVWIQKFIQKRGN